MVHKGNVGGIIPALGLPCVLVQADKPFSMDVEKAQTQAQLHARVNALPEKSQLVIAQEWLPAGFDRRVQFACRYHKAPGHWQIVSQHDERRSDCAAGPTVACGIGKSPHEVVRPGSKAANLMGDRSTASSSGRLTTAAWSA